MSLYGQGQQRMRLLHYRLIHSTKTMSGKDVRGGWRHTKMVLLFAFSLMTQGTQRLWLKTLKTLLRLLRDILKYI